MAGGYSAFRGPNDSVGPIVDAVSALDKRSTELERFNGTSLTSLVTQVQTALANINSTVQTAIAANSYTQTQIDSKDSATLSSAESYAAQQVANLLAGSPTFQGTITAVGDVHGSNAYFSSAPGNNITATRVAAWLRSSDGLLGTASSSEEFKENITPVPLDHARGLLKVAPSYFQYKAELAMRDDPTSPNYVGPDYHVSTNIGGIAEQFEAAGLWEFVVYERDADGNAILDANGNPHPWALHDILIGYGILVLVQDHEARLAALESAAGIAPTP